MRRFGPRLGSLVHAAKLAAQSISSNMVVRLAMLATSGKVPLREVSCVSGARPIRYSGWGVHEASKAEKTGSRTPRDP